MACVYENDDISYHFKELFKLDLKNACYNDTVQVDHDISNLAKSIVVLCITLGFPSTAIEKK